MPRWLIVIFLAFASLFAYADETWKQPLHKKEQLIEAGIQKKHSILGLYPSQVQIPRDGGSIDITTSNPFADIQHAIDWTANYLAGLSYKYAFLKESQVPAAQLKQVKARVDEVFEAVYRCQLVTGVKGLQARGYFLGHGETYAERRHSSKLPFWRQGKINGQSFRWVGDPSHHNYSDAIHGLGQYYTLAAEGKQKERARQAIDSLVSYWVDNDLKIAKYDKSLREVPILGITDGETLNNRVMMAIAGAKIAHVATGKEKFKNVYENLIAQYGVRTLESFKTDKNFDDAEHVFCHLDLLFRIEDDPQLLNAYRQVADGLWANHKNDAQSLFTYIYYNLAPGAPGKATALKQALYSLQTFPTDTTLKPRMNSLNPNTKPPYPVHSAAWDNEYIWKGHLRRADGWLSRHVVDVAVSSEDPMIIYAVGQGGGLYQSRDGAATWQNWHPVDQTLHASVVDVDVGRRTRIVAAACHDGFYLSTTGGAHWSKLPVPQAGGRPLKIQFHPENSHVLFAVTSTGVYRSLDYGGEYLGQTWQALTGTLPPLEAPKFYIAPGRGGRLYAVSENRLFTRKLNEEQWTRGADFGLEEYADTYPWLAVDPIHPEHLLAGILSDNPQFGTLSILQKSHDAGHSWSNNFPSILNYLSKYGLQGIFTLGVRKKLDHLIMEPQNPSTLYAAAERGVLVSEDGGQTWINHQKGFSIPLVQSLMKPRHTDWLFAGTPGGLFISKDDGKTWQDGNLWLQFDKNNRRELGGAAYIDAYWRARYFGFIDDDTAYSTHWFDP